MPMVLAAAKVILPIERRLSDGALPVDQAMATVG
jgi:hypothetical protein